MNGFRRYPFIFFNSAGLCFKSAVFPCSSQKHEYIMFFASGVLIACPSKNIQFSAKNSVHQHKFNDLIFSIIMKMLL